MVVYNHDNMLTIILCDLITVALDISVLAHGNFYLKFCALK